jgi:hypothetical protein
MDVHEYFPYGEAWQKYGYHNNSDLLLGTATNSNVSVKLRELSNKSCVPFIREYLDAGQISNFLYSPGGPPEIEYIRHSTFDINDGRQSFAIQNTFSFIQEGINGKDYSADNLRHRAEGQMTGMRGLLEFTYQNKKKIKDMVTADRRELISRPTSTVISIQCEHTANGQKIDLPVLSYSTGIDTVLTVVDYRPVVKSLYDIGRPEGYLIPKKLKELTDWTDRQGIIHKPFTNTGLYKIEQYEISNIDSIDFEGDKIVNPEVNSAFLQTAVTADDYIYVPTSQLKGNLVAIALEPKSMLGLVTYKQFAHLLKPGGKFPVLRVVSIERGAESRER